MRFQRGASDRWAAETQSRLTTSLGVAVDVDAGVGVGPLELRDRAVNVIDFSRFSAQTHGGPSGTDPEARRD
jgi:hypothetical protein